MATKNKKKEKVSKGKKVLGMLGTATLKIAGAKNQKDAKKKLGQILG